MGIGKIIGNAINTVQTSLENAVDEAKAAPPPRPSVPTYESGFEAAPPPAIEGGEAPQVVDKNRSAVNGLYHLEEKDAPRAKMDEQVSLAPDDQRSRRRFLEKLTQVDPDRMKPHNTNGCAAACVLASCLQQQQPAKALGKLCDYMLDQQNGSRIKEENRAQLETLKGRIDKGEPITRADVEFLQENTYDALQVAERSVEGANQDNLNVNIGAVRKVLEDSGVGYAGGVPVFIDVDRVKDKNGNYQGEHFVLQRPGIPGEFYDPWPRAGGKQLIREGGGGVHDIGAYEVYRSSIKDSTLLHLD